MRRQLSFALSALAACALAASGTATAAPITWNIVSSASSVSFAIPNQTFTLTSSSSIASGLIGTSLSISLRALNPNSAASGSTPTGWTIGNKQNVSGYFATDTDFVSSIKFLNGPGANFIDGIDSGNFSPLPDGSEPGTASADIATRLYIGAGILIGGLNLDLAFRNMLYDVSSGVIPVSSGSFNSNLASFGNLDSDIAYKARNGFGLGGGTFVDLIGSGYATELGGASTTSTGAAPGTIVVTPKIGGDVAKLTLPFNIPINMALDEEGLLTLKLNVTGTLVATAIVPEPTTYALLAIGMSCMAPAAIRRWRRRGS
ncbi:MAG: PEP-CTERM sorting domain-containing protein [Planctomycetaceae bacterium]|nr:PEP-CTERM sorting domain-containing protein [Planctomycetaceae bacterium]